MDCYVTAATIKTLRVRSGMTQAQLAERLHVSSKAVSRWETGKGFPDISLLEPLAAALGVSVIALMSGVPITNRNAAGNLNRLQFYICPICGNVLFAMGEAVTSCCGLTLPAAEPEPADTDHIMQVEEIEDELYVTVSHPMEKAHAISFLAYVTSDRIELKKLYPEGEVAARFFPRGDGDLYCCCNLHGLWKQPLSPITAVVVCTYS